MNLLAPLAVLFALMQSPPPATFEGVFKAFESGHVVIEVEQGQPLRMFVTSSTKYIRDGKKSKASEFHDGDPVEVDAERDLRMNLVALRIEAIKPKPPEPPGDKPDPGKN
jgi:hypothetical protein